MRNNVCDQHILRPRMQPMQNKYCEQQTRLLQTPRMLPSIRWMQSVNGAHHAICRPWSLANDVVNDAVGTCQAQAILILMMGSIHTILLVLLHSYRSSS